MSTDVKYKDRCDVKDVVLFTCSNYPIEMYCNVPLAQDAVNSRTIRYELKVRSMVPKIKSSCVQIILLSFTLLIHEQSIRIINYETY